MMSEAARGINKSKKKTRSGRVFFYRFSIGAIAFYFQNTRIRRPLMILVTFHPPLALGGKARLHFVQRHGNGTGRALLVRFDAQAGYS